MAPSEATVSSKLMPVPTYLPHAHRGFVLLFDLPFIPLYLGVTVELNETVNVTGNVEVSGGAAVDIQGSFIINGPPASPFDTVFL